MQKNWQGAALYSQLGQARTGVLVVGAGFAGAVCARVLAESGCRVEIVEKRTHVAGNAFDEFDASGILVHRYGPHIFHTNSKTVFGFLSRFTKWRRYEHRVLSDIGNGQLYPIPINRKTLSLLLGKPLDEEDAKAYLDSVRDQSRTVRTSEDAVIASVGPRICDLFFRGYTQKQWGLGLSELSASVASRIPTRTNDDDRYFTDIYQALPAEGYTVMFERMLSHPNIQVHLSTPFDPSLQASYSHVIYTGPIDEYFGSRFGRLPYRSLEFAHRHIPNCLKYQPVGTVNFPNTEAYTRITEFKSLTGQQHSGTSIVEEYPKSYGAPYYPIPRPENEQKYQAYKNLARQEEHVTFVGRLAEYRYRNMDQVVATALKKAKQLSQQLIAA